MTNEEKVTKAESIMKDYKDGRGVFWVGFCAWLIGTLMFLGGMRFALAVMWAGIVVEWAQVIHGTLLLRKAKKLLESIA
jgi:hypothetical protein